MKKTTLFLILSFSLTNIVVSQDNLYFEDIEIGFSIYLPFDSSITKMNENNAFAYIKVADQYYYMGITVEYFDGNIDEFIEYLGFLMDGVSELFSSIEFETRIIEKEIFILNNQINGYRLIIETIVKMNLENNLSEDRVVFYYYFFKNPNINKYIAISCLGVEDIFIKEEYIKTLEFLE